MVRGTFANVRIKNLMVPGTEGGVTIHQPTGEQMPIYDASDPLPGGGRPARRLRRAGVRHRLVARLGGEGDAAARRQGRRRRELRAHPPLATSSAWACCRCQFKDGTSTPQTLALDGTETFDITGFRAATSRRARTSPCASAAPDGEEQEVPVTLRIDTPIEIEYYRHGGILPFVLRQLISQSS